MGARLGGGVSTAALGPRPGGFCLVEDLEHRLVSGCYGARDGHRGRGSLGLEKDGLRPKNGDLCRPLLLSKPRIGFVRVIIRR